MTTKYWKMKQLVNELNLPEYRHAQILNAVFRQNINRFEEMRALPLILRQKLIETFGDTVISLARAQEEQSGQANKILFSMKDGNEIEAVALHYKKGWESFCISTQCGCGFGCRFCATGTIGLKRNLTADEITDQLLYFRQNGHKLSSISFMGMGEPFANPHLFSALRDLTNPQMFGLSQRRITISTIGIVPGIRRLIKEYPQINLAFSLHSPDNRQRSELMPINRQYPVCEVMDALDHYIDKTHRRVFLAYIMLKGENDSKAHAYKLASLLRAHKRQFPLYHIDLIPYNTTDKTEQKFAPSDLTTMQTFQGILRQANISVATRLQFGSEIGAACGQLYAEQPSHQCI